METVESPGSRHTVALLGCVESRFPRRVGFIDTANTRRNKEAVAREGGIAWTSAFRNGNLGVSLSLSLTHTHTLKKWGLYLIA